MAGWWQENGDKGVVGINEVSCDGKWREAAAEDVAVDGG